METEYFGGHFPLFCWKIPKRTPGFRVGLFPGDAKIVKRLGVEPRQRAPLTIEGQNIQK